MRGSVEFERPISALLSQVLVAFTLEFDNEFERRMIEARYPGSLSLVVWTNLMRFVSQGGVPIRDLAARALSSEAQIKFPLGCLERWRFVVLGAEPTDERAVPVRMHRQAGRILRDGWGSGRGIRSGWIVHLTEKGRTACEIWPPLFELIERRWEARFGEDAIGRLREVLEAAAGQLDLELPQALPFHSGLGQAYAARVPHPKGGLPLPALLSQLLLQFTLEFDRESQVPLMLCANTLRVLSERPTPVADVARLTGASPETSGIGWQMKPYVALEPGPAGSRGKLVHLTPRGLSAQRKYHELTAQIGKQWDARFGKDIMDGLRERLVNLLVRRIRDRALLSEGLIPAEETIRSGKAAPALGRRTVASAGRQRMRDLVAQTEMVLRDPAGTLPHYPLWDMNRGFGP
jgi:hypothetical protein